MGQAIFDQDHSKDPQGLALEIEGKLQGHFRCYEKADHRPGSGQLVAADYIARKYFLVYVAFKPKNNNP